MKIITLIENLAYQSGLVAEHGLSLYIETGNKKVLFDTGQSSHFIKNAVNLGINLTDIDAVVISHGHYDHTGGLHSFLAVNSKATVCITKEAFAHKYHNKRFIGISYEPMLPDSRIKYIDEITELDKGVFMVPDIPLTYPVDTHFQNFYIHKNNGFEKDEFSDEQFLTIIKNNEISIITGCSHRGITNIIETARQYFPLPVNLILGGFHLKDSTDEQFTHVTNYVNKLQPKSIGVCHCTGIEKYAGLRENLKNRVFYNYTGLEITDL